MKQGRSSGFGWILVLIGLLWFASDVGWLPKNLPLFPIFLVLLGLLFLLR